MKNGYILSTSENKLGLFRCLNFCTMVLCLLMLFCSTTVQGDDKSLESAKSKFEAFKTAITKKSGQEKSGYTSSFERWDDMLKNGQHAKLASELKQYNTLVPTLELVALLEKIGERELEKKTAETKKQYESAMKAVANILNKAKQASELDDTLKLLSEQKQHLNSYSSSYTGGVNAMKLMKLQQKYLQDVSNAVRVVSSWQDYLSAKQSRNSSNAKSALRSLSQTLQTFPIIPRSKVLKLLEEYESGGSRSTNHSDGEIIMRDYVNGLSATDILEKYKNMEGIGTRSNAALFLASLQKLADYQKPGQFVSIQELINDYKSHQNRSASVAQNKLTTEYGKLIIVKLQKDHGMSVPSEPHSPAAFLEEYINSAVSKADYAQVKKAITLAEQVKSHSHEYSNLKKAIDCLIDGDQFVKADLWREAILSYRKGIKQQARILPGAVFAKRLLALQQQDKDRYQRIARLAADVETEKEYQKTAGIIWRLNQYILSNPRYKASSNRPIPHNLQAIIQEFVALEVKKQLKQAEAEEDKKHHKAIVPSTDTKR